MVAVVRGYKYVDMSDMIWPLKKIGVEEYSMFHGLFNALKKSRSSMKLTRLSFLFCTVWRKKERKLYRALLSMQMGR